MKSVIRLFSLCLLSLFPFTASAEPVTTILNSGPSANRVDIVVLGDGYTQAELPQYAIDVQNAIDDFFAAPPFDEYKSYFNVHVIDVVSNESGSDHSEADPATYKDTALDSRYNCNSSARLICVDTGKVQTILNNSISATQQDIKLIIVNDPVYGGSGGSVAVASTNASSSELVLHEIGHSFGLLADEYTYGSNNCNAPVEPAQVNVTTQTSRAQIKWNNPNTGWIDTNTPLPTVNTTAGVVGLFEGGKYCPNNIYRPTHNSKMRNLNQPFEQINEEQLVKRIYNFVSPLDSQLPAQLNIDLTPGEVRDFQITALQPLQHNLSIEWKLDGTVIGTGTTYQLDTANITLGNHILSFEIEDLTPKVRYDPANALTESGQWHLNLLIRGDCTGDGAIDIADVICTINLVLSTGLPNGNGADVDNDGDVDITDVIATINIVLSL